MIHDIVHFLTLIVVHELHGGHVTNLFADVPLPPPGYFMVTSTHPVAGN